MKFYIFLFTICFCSQVFSSSKDKETQARIDFIHSLSAYGPHIQKAVSKLLTQGGEWFRLDLRFRLLNDLMPLERGIKQRKHQLLNALARHDVEVILALLSVETAFAYPPAVSISAEEFKKRDQQRIQLIEALIARDFKTMIEISSQGVFFHRPTLRTILGKEEVQLLEEQEAPFLKKEIALYDSISVSDPNIVRELLEQGANPNIVSPFNLYETPLHEAVRYDFTDIAFMLIKQMPNLNIINPLNSETPLHEAAGFGYSDMVVLLVENGADINTLNYRGETPLQSAINESKWTTAETLTRLGAQVSPQDQCRMLFKRSFF